MYRDGSEAKLYCILNREITKDRFYIKTHYNY